jgi:hypothetical protein
MPLPIQFFFIHFFAESLPQDSAPTPFLYYTILFFTYPAFSFLTHLTFSARVPEAGDSAEKKERLFTHLHLSWLYAPCISMLVHPSLCFSIILLLSCHSHSPRLLVSPRSCSPATPTKARVSASGLCAYSFPLLHHSLLHLPCLRLPSLILPASARVPEAGDSAETEVSSLHLNNSHNITKDGWENFIHASRCKNRNNQKSNYYQNTICYIGRKKEP